MGGAQPLAATMNGATCLIVEVNPANIQRRIDTGYCDHLADDLDQALSMAMQAKTDFIIEGLDEEEVQR
jgi:urocanate hydratase